MRNDRERVFSLTVSARINSPYSKPRKLPGQGELNLRFASGFTQRRCPDFAVFRSGIYALASTRSLENAFALSPPY